MKLLLTFLLGIFASMAQAQDVFTARAPESKVDTRQNYYIAILDLALQKTQGSYGPYILNLAPQGANMKRSREDAETGKYENYFIRQSVSKDRLEKMEAVPFPVDLGIVGYRIAFLSKKTKSELKKIKTLDELKNFSIVQGLGWLDKKILEWNGFSVINGGAYEGMFHMVARDRADLFTRGVNEVLDEWNSHKHIENLEYDEEVVLYYPLPRFFFTAKKNKKSANRIYEGLVMAYQDGSLLKLWLSYYGPSIDFTKLEKRKLFEIENPFLDGLNQEYKKYIYKPSFEN